jgi:formamidopyrimidine-DNA glycosylase
VPELPEVEVVRRGLARHVVDRTIARVDVAHPRAVRRHIEGGDDFAARLVGRTITAARRRGKYLWLELADCDRSGHDAPDPGDAVLAHLGMSGQMLVAAPGRPDEKHLRIRIAFDDDGAHPSSGTELRFVDQRTFGGLSVHPLVPAAASDGRLPGVVRSSLADARCDAPAPFAVASDGRLPGVVRSSLADARCDAPAPFASGDGELLPAPISHIARDPMDPAFSLDDAVAAILRRRTELKRALLDQTAVSGIGNIYADEALWRARLHGARPTEKLTRTQGRAVLTAAAEVMDEALAQGGTSFDALYVNVNGASGYFDRSLAAYGQADRPCPRCGTPIRREPFMNRSSFSCPRCQPRPRRPAL